MRKLIVLCCILSFSCISVFSQTTKQRVVNLEKRVGKVEKKVNALEKKVATQKDTISKQKKQIEEKIVNPIAAYYISSEEYSDDKAMGLMAVVVIENLSAKPVYSFTGNFKFKTSNGKTYFTYPYVQSNMIDARKRQRVLIPIDAAKYPKTFLRLKREKKINVFFEDQKIY